MFVPMMPEDKTELISQTLQMLYIKKKMTDWWTSPNKLPLTECSTCLELVTTSSIIVLKKTGA
jgi:hypothetical protein